MNLYVANLPYETTESEFEAAFEPYGRITRVTIVKDRDTGRSRGFGFIEFQDKDAGQQALSEMNGADFNGRALVVDQAKESRR